MPEEAEAPVEEQETPEQEAPEGTPSEPESKEDEGKEPDIDYRKRFEDLHPELTKSQQENAELRRLFQAAQQGDQEALEILGLSEEEAGEEYDDPEEELRAELDQLKEHLTGSQREQEAREIQEQEIEHIDEELDAFEKEAGFELSEEAIDFIVDRALANRGEGEMPSVKDAGKVFMKVLEAERDRYIEKRENAPKPPVGDAGEEKVDTSDDEQRQRYLARLMEAEGS